MDGVPRKHNESKKEDKDQESIQSSPHLTQDTNWKVTHSQLDITNERQEVSPFQAGGHKAPINRRARKHDTNNTEKCHWNKWFMDVVPRKHMKERGQRSGIDTIKPTPDRGFQLESDTFTIRHHTRETRGQPFPIRGPQGINKQTRTKAWQKQDRKMSLK